MVAQETISYTQLVVKPVGQKQQTGRNHLPPSIFFFRRFGYWILLINIYFFLLLYPKTHFFFSGPKRLPKSSSFVLLLNTLGRKATTRVFIIE